MNMRMDLMRVAVGGVVGVVVMANVAAAGNVAVGVDVNTPNVRVQVGSQPAPPPPHVTVVERERIIVKEKHDNGKHKGHHKKHKKHKD